MPSRFLKESICTSDNLDRLTEFQEVFFYRLIVNCDDFGRFDARPKLMSSKLFPLRDISEEKVCETLDALIEAELITVYRVRNKPYLQVITWENHQQRRATASKYPGPEEADGDADDIGCNQLITDDNKCYQPISDDNKCHRIRIRNTYSYNDNRIRDTRARADDDDDDGQMISSEDAGKIQGDHNRVMDAAEDAGFKVSNSVRAQLIKLYAEYGLEKMLKAFESCVKHGAPTLAYLEACLKGKPKKEKAAVSAQDYEQRDYADIEQAIMRQQMQEAAEYLGKSG